MREKCRCRRGDTRPSGSSVLGLVLALALSAASLSGCLVIGGGGKGGWQTGAGSVSGDWRQLDMQDLMAYSDSWFVVDEAQRGTVRGFPSGAVSMTSDGGFFELSVIARSNGVPLQQTVRVYFDRWTPVYLDGERKGTVYEGLTGDALDIVRAGRMLEVPFHINGGQLNAEQVDVTDKDAPELK